MAKIRKKHRIRIRIIITLLVIVTAAVILQFMIQPDRKTHLTIIFSSGMKGQLQYTAQTDTEESHPGYDTICSVISNADNSRGKVLVLDTGDAFSGSTYAENNNGQSVIQLMNAAGYTAMVPGIMDFSYGYNQMTALKGSSSFPLLAANIKTSEGADAFDTYRIVTDGGVRIGIIGVTNGLDKTTAAEYGLQVISPVEAVSQTATKISSRTDVIIVTFYAGITDTQSVQAIAAVDGVKLVLAGGTSEASSTVTDKGAMIVTASDSVSAVGEVHMDINRHEAASEFAWIDPEEYVTASVSDDLGEVISSAYAAVNTDSSQVIGTVTDKYAAAAEDFYSGEVALGSLTADALLNAGAAEKAQIALVPSGVFKSGLTAGKLTRSDIYNLFDSTLYAVSCRITGGEVKALIEAGAAAYPSASDSFLQVSGLTYAFDSKTGLGSRVQEVLVNEKSIDDSATYVVVVPSSMLTGHTETIKSYNTVGTLLADYLTVHTELLAADKSSDGAAEGTDKSLKTAARITVNE